MPSDDIAACAGIVAKGDPDRFRAAMAAPVALRARLLPLYAFNIEVSRAPWLTREAPIAEMRLQWWRDALDEIARRSVVRRHEVVTPLSVLLEDADCAVLDDLILARRWDIYRDPFEDQAAFAAHIDATAGGLMWVAARLCGAPDGVEAAVRDIAHAQGLASWFAAIPALEAAGRLPLVDGRPEAIRALAAGGLARLARGRAGLRALPRAARAALLPAALAGAQLDRVRRDPSRVAEGTLRGAEGWARLALMRAALTGRV